MLIIDDDVVTKHGFLKFMLDSHKRVENQNPNRKVAVCLRGNSFNQNNLYHNDMFVPEACEEDFAEYFRVSFVGDLDEE